jgi:hypothetical protein
MFYAFLNEHRIYKGVLSELKWARHVSAIAAAIARHPNEQMKREERE